MENDLRLVFVLKVGVIDWKTFENFISIIQSDPVFQE